MANVLREQLKVGVTRVAILLRGHSSFRNVVPGRLPGGTSRDIMAVSCSLYLRLATSGLLSVCSLQSCRDAVAVMCLGQVVSFDGGSSSAVPRSVFRVPPTHPTYMHR